MFLPVIHTVASVRAHARLQLLHPLTRLFFAIASPDTFADLREACSAVREQGVFTALQHTNTLKDTVKAIDPLDSTAFADRNLRRHYLVHLVEHRHQREAYHKSGPKTRDLRRTRHGSPQSDHSSTRYEFGLIHQQRYLIQLISLPSS